MRTPRPVYWAAFAIGVGVGAAEAYSQSWLLLLLGAMFGGITLVIVAWLVWEPLSLVGVGLRRVYNKLFPRD